MKHAAPSVSLLVVAVLFLIGCAAVENTEHQVLVTGFDFTQYSKLGFLFTPQPPSGEYESVGVINVKVVPAVIRVTSETPPPDRGSYYTTRYGEHKYWIEEVKPSDVVKEMYAKAVDMGADALTSFKVDVLTEVHSGISVAVYQVSGFAIKRKPAANH